MKYDIYQKIWFYTIAIMGFGLVALYSASYHNVRVPQKIFYDQLICAVLGCFLLYFISKIDYRRFYDAAYIFYIINILLLVWVLLSGRHALGATRWIQWGPVSFQPSELTKLSLILVLGRYLSNRRPALSFGFFTQAQVIWKDVIVPLIMTGVLMLLIFKQPDLGTSLLMLGIYFAVIFAAGIEYRYIFTLLGVILSVAPFAWSILKDYQKDRLLVFLNPNIDPLGAGYTIIQSKIAVGSGQIFGKGWLSGTQNQLNFLPERHTDFIFSVIGEEWGLLGTITLVLLYLLLILNGL
ncbi:MAG: rod shape-determining protein RodA, partial [Candidatus Omnitrophica bacterium]|nr:rod shape-determining protein RodA [Candidatus Omnitrophota bacterium]